MVYVLVDFSVCMSKFVTVSSKILVCSSGPVEQYTMWHSTGPHLNSGSAFISDTGTKIPTE